MLQTFGVKICQILIDKFCQDSKKYLKILTEGKINLTKKSKQTNTTIVAADTAALYSTISKYLVQLSLKKALQAVSSYSREAEEIIVEVVMLFV